jgi:hypothetical protein
MTFKQGDIGPTPRHIAAGKVNRLFYGQAAVLRDSLELLDLLVDTAAETVEDGAHAAHEREYAPEQRAAENVHHLRFGVRQKQDSPCDHVGADDDTTMTEDQRRHPAGFQRQNDQRCPYK